jgi:hypothetical protein
LKQILCRLGKDLSWLRPFSGERLKRFGCDHDGGYVLPSDCLERIDGLLSFGVDRNWSFERQVRQRHPKIPLHAYDPSVSERIFYREKRAALVRLLTLRGSYSKFQETSRILEDFKDTFSAPACHFRERAHDQNVGKGDCDMSKAFSRLSGCKNLLVKMDIEGAEYRVLPGLIGFASRIGYLTLEFHETGAFRKTFEDIVRKIQKTHFIAHLHGNNGGEVAKDGLPELLEISFVKGRPRAKAKVATLPNDLVDSCNVPGRNDYKISWSR